MFFSSPQSMIFYCIDKLPSSNTSEDLCGNSKMKTSPGPHSSPYLLLFLGTESCISFIVFGTFLLSVLFLLSVFCFFFLNKLGYFKKECMNSDMCMTHLNPGVISVRFCEKLQQPLCQRPGPSHIVFCSF